MAATWLAAGGELPFGVKPPQPVVNRGHPLAQGLVFDVQYEALGGASVDLAYAAKGAFSGTTASIPGVGPHGALRTFASGANTAVDTYVTPAPVNGLTRLTLEALVKFNGLGNGGGGDGRVIWKGGATTYTALTWLAGNVTLDFGWSTTAGSWSTTSGVVTQSVWHHIVMTYDFASTGSVPRLWVDGVEAALALNTTPAGSPLADTTALLIGNRPAGDRAINANLSHIRLWNRRFSGGEVAQLYTDPFQLYVRPAPSVYWAAPDDGAFTGTGAATLAITASATGVRGVAGTASATLALAASGTGSHIAPVTGTGSATLTLAASATGKHGVTGTATATLAVTASASGGHGVAGSASATLTLAASGTGAFASGVAGTGSAVLGVTGSGVGKHGVSGAAAATLTLTASGSGAHGVRGSASATLSISGSGIGSAATVVTGAGSANLIIVGSGLGLFARVIANPVTGRTASASTITGRTTTAASTAGRTTQAASLPSAITTEAAPASGTTIQVT